MIAISVIVGLLVLVVGFWLGRWSMAGDIRSAREELDIWRDLVDELHEENFQLRKGAL